MIGNYRLIRVLGQGGQGSVYLGEENNKLYAIKIVYNFNKTNLKEVELLEKISKPKCHPNISCYYDHFIEGNKLIIVMEYIEGESLYDYSLRLRQMNHPKLYKFLLLILKDIINGIKYIHQHNILHNDLNSANIMIDQDLTPKLIDFGLSCSTNNCELYNKTIKCCTGHSGAPEFGSPEMYLDDIRYSVSDIWSLGISLYTSAVGKYPFFFESSSIRDTVIKTQPLKLETDNELLNYLVNSMLIKNPSNRITVDQIQYLLRDL